MRPLPFTVCSSALALAAAAACGSTFHLMQIEQVVGGVEGDTSAQAIQLRMRSAGQNLLTTARLVAYDADGENEVVLLEFDKGVPKATLGSRILIVSKSFAAHTDPPVEADFVLDKPIPASYLAAGRLTFENASGTEIVWSLAWGGDDYNGPHNGSFFNDNNGNFGPAFPEPMPTDGRGLIFTGSASDQSFSNEEDYIITDGPAVVTNNNGDTFTVVIGDECYPDCDGTGIVNLFDFFCFVTNFNGGDPYADCDNSGAINLFDFFCFVSEFNAGC